MIVATLVPSALITTGMAWMALPVDTTQAILLVIIAFIGGIGTTALGPGGILVTIGLFLLTDLSPAEIAGTTIVVHIGAGLIGGLAYLRSGQLRGRPARTLALTLAIAALLGAPAGTLINSRMSGAVFGILLALMVMAVGLSVLLRERSQRPRSPEAPTQPSGVRLGAAIGLATAVASGMFGVGGPVFSVPILVLGGVPIVQAIAASQVQSIVVGATGLAAYTGQGATIWPLAILIGVPQLAGVVIGWKVARALPRRPLTYALAITLILLGPVTGIVRLTD